MKNILKKTAAIIFAMAMAVCMFTGAANIYVVKSTDKFKITAEEAAQKDIDCVVVLGAAVKNGKPSYMLKDRLDKAIEIYNLKEGKCTILMSGNGGKNDRPDEIKAMTEYAIENGVEKDRIAADPKGYSTYESMYRTYNTLGYKSFIVVTQKYHLSRALYSANAIGAEVYGTAAKNIRYRGQIIRDVREILARVKDLGLSKIKYSV